MRINCYYTCLFLVATLSIISCSQEKETFQLVDGVATGITFNNEIPESDSLNIIINNYLYNGAGVGIADFNKDSLPDIFFAGNLTDNQLYLNTDKLTFQNISSAAGIQATGQWISGVNVIDFNQDGWQDIYLTCTFHEDANKRKNILFIHQGLDDSGNPYFKDQAAAYGLADDSYNTHSFSFDYDLDGDLDLYLLTNKLDLPKTMGLHKKIKDGSSPSTDRLYRNNGNLTFTDVSNEAGITHHGFGLGIALLDANEDGYPDLYVSNDFVSNDFLWVNQQDGTFKNEIMHYLDHQSFSSMGNNVGDLDNDGLLDIVTLDMLPEEDTRMKMMFGGANHYYYDIMLSKDYEIQYPRNTIQINQGNGHFSDIAMLLDMDATDWSWSPLMGDFDNNGKNDLFITNGFPRDITDLDFSDFHSGMNVLMSANARLLNKIPIVKIDNHLYLQQENWSFKKAHENATFSQPSFSNGAAISDLDRDGDLDLVVSNINDPAFIYQNTTAQNSTNNYLQFSVSDATANGALVSVYTPDQVYTKQYQFNRGYCSTSENLLHFGLGQAEVIDSIVIRTSNQQVSKITKPSVNQHLILPSLSNNLHSVNRQKKQVVLKSKTRLEPIENELTKTPHAYTKFYDFNIQPQIQKLSSEDSPPVVVADLNKDGLDDCILDIGENRPLQFFYQLPEGGFEQKQFDEIDSIGERNGLLAVDLNGDEYLDLYLAKGSLPSSKHPAQLKDEIYWNINGLSFQKEESFEGAEVISSCVVATDYDKDGDVDLFVGGRVQPGKWPLPPRSILYQNNKGTLKEVTANWAKELSNIGMVTAAIWTDVDRDTWMDLIVVGRWMPPTLFKNIEGDHFEKQEMPSLQKSHGLWNSISAADLDQDGYIDYVLGNQGVNNKYRLDKDHPIYLYAKDFDANGSMDPIISHYVDGIYKPYHLRNPLLKQVRSLAKHFTSYISYAESPTENILAQLKVDGMLELKVDVLEHIILWNEKGHGFLAESLPMITQISAGNGILIDDLNQDLLPDILFTGNDYGTEVFNGRNNAGTGTIIKNLGDRKLKAIPAVESNYYNEGNTRGLVKYFDEANKEFLYLLVRHGEQPLLKRNSQTNKYEAISVPSSLHQVEIFYEDGTKAYKELYNGEGYRSQTSRKILLTPSVVRIIGIDQSGGESVLFNKES